MVWEFRSAKISADQRSHLLPLPQFLLVIPIPMGFPAPSMASNKLPTKPRILTTTVGSYPVPDWLAALPSEQAVIDATRVVSSFRRSAR